jgi:hypothetical protein
VRRFECVVERVRKTRQRLIDHAAAGPRHNHRPASTAPVRPGMSHASASTVSRTRTAIEHAACSCRSKCSNPTRRGCVVTQPGYKARRRPRPDGTGRHSFRRGPKLAGSHRFGSPASAGRAGSQGTTSAGARPTGSPLRGRQGDYTYRRSAFSLLLTRDLRGLGSGPPIG